MNVTFDCADPPALAGFWSEALGVPVDADGGPFFRTLGMTDPSVSPKFMFLMVAEPKTAKNRMHLDFTTDDKEQEARRLVALGATRLADHDEYGLSWIVLADPEGNEFCVANRRS
jgi:predicted enzyme related to lactoylglutathione lyase